MIGNLTYLHNGHEAGHLTEDEHPVSGCPQLWQNTVEQFELARGTEEQLALGLGRWRLTG